ncbi:hypothetical protein [uncultured Flavobacterium sp.]|uniref:hypothetical protein n=1 Tax=uncultured Flavobacterium sp. TaxID=165435 RepID=UPI0025DEF647|nr:hypothetical protein [uncultured Flavobacterium sp.]
MKTKIILAIILFSTACVQAQLGIGNTSPQGTLHVDGRSNNPTTGTPNATQAADDFVVKSDGKVGVGTITPQANLDVRGTVRFTDTKNNLLAGASKKLSINSTTGEVGYVAPGGGPVLYRTTAATRTTETFSNSTWIVAPINVSATNVINNIGASVGTASGAEYIEFSKKGTYRIELIGYLQLNQSFAAQASTHVRLRKSNSSGIPWVVVDNQRLGNDYPYANTTEVLRPFVYIGVFEIGERIMFDMATQNSGVSATGGWGKPSSNNNSIKLIITKL